ncbi:ATP-binding protein [Arhodomonas sp. AD133]|uniref:HAMP domain-containing sensor histidine kinase n=1 Tax=Arhodomonas sp. AD133 TaxID=3415009 RepID=UPI003EBE3105
MRPLRPRSLLSLILFGFGVVILPLFVALGYAGVYVDRLSEQAQTTVYDAARAIQLSSNLDDVLTRLERAARQYLVLDDAGLLDVYRDAHEQLQDNVLRLRQIAATVDQQRLLETLETEEAELFESLTAEQPAEGLDQEAVAERFIGLGELADGVRARSNDVIDREVARMQRLGAMAQRWLFWMGAALLPLTLISAGIFTVLISRPIREVEGAIRRLGDEQFDAPVQVSGPRDLEVLGERLDWLRQRLVELENQKTRFLRHVSHELKTPLTSIRESSQLLSDEIVGPLNDEQREISAILHDSGRRLQDLIEDLLDFSRTQNRTPQLNVRTVSLEQIVTAVLARHKAAIRARRVKLRRDLQRGRLEGDAEKLETVVDNLISNSVKFSPKGGTLSVRVEERNEAVVLEVADEGPGIPAGERAKIFDAFFQGDRQPEGYVKGSGLGLSITREYVLAHHGDIELLTDEDSHGAHFRITLPRRHDEVRPRESVTTTPTTRSA